MRTFGNSYHGLFGNYLIYHSVGGLLRMTFKSFFSSKTAVRHTLHFLNRHRAPRGGKRAEFPRCFPENVDLNFLGFRNPVFSIDTIWNPILQRGCLFLLFRSTLVVKIKKTQESTPSVLVMPKKNNRG